MPLLTIAILLISICSSRFAEALKCEGCNSYECWENIAHCGPKGYLIAYGEKYCRKFGEKEIYERFDEDGQKFINCTRECLFDYMGHYIQKHSQPSVDCAALKKAGFQSHPKCYLHCGFCRICKNNKLALLSSYDFRDFLSLDAIKQVFIVIQKCGLFDCFLSIE